MPVPRATDDSDTNTLPDPELNPLLNPLLAAHMGRWAEVYFTNPPERRGQAVAELLRELENLSPPPPAPVQIIDPAEGEKETAPAEAPDLAPTAADLVRTCSTCAHNNAAGQRFCGMCGAPLLVTPEAHVAQVAKAMSIFEATSTEPEALAGSAVERGIESAVISDAADSRRDDLDPALPLPERDLPYFAAESESVPYRYRLYVGVVLAILLAVLIFMAWRGTKALSGAAAPQSTPSRVIQPAPTAPPTSAQQAGATPSALREGNPPASPVQSQDRSDAGSRKDQVAEARPALQIAPVAVNPSAAASEPSGAEELAMAEKYLNPNSGKPRDSQEAAQWLWKAVRKRNLAATMALSDLYLRGDGVPKSCDQARLLLDAAARKGGTAAAERLRNLQAFGCE
jgi:hypothetical protein